MLYIQFVIDNDRYLLPTDKVVTIMPTVQMQPVSGMQAYFPGCVNFRGETVPVIDVVQLFKGRAARQRLSTRIIVITMNTKAHQQNKVGLLVEKVIELIKLEDGDFSGLTADMQKISGLDAAAEDEYGVLYRVRSDKLLPRHELGDLLCG